MSERATDYWEGYRASMVDLRVTLTGWTLTGDVEGLIDLIDTRLEGMGRDDPDPIPFQDEPHWRATDPHGGNGVAGKRFPVATSYTAVVEDDKVIIVKAGLPEDHFEPDQAEGFAEHLKRCAARARLPLEPGAKTGGDAR